MSQTYIFHDQAGTIPGVPGMFSHCVVTVDEEGNLTFDHPQATYEMPANIVVAEEVPPALEQPIEQQEQEELPELASHNETEENGG